MTLGEALGQGATFLVFKCEGFDDRGAPCDHLGRMDVADAIERWGRRCKLQKLFLCCSNCGSTKVEVSPRSIKALTGGHGAERRAALESSPLRHSSDTPAVIGARASARSTKLWNT